MSSLTNYLELKLLDHTFGVAAYTRPATVYLGLLKADPTEAGTVTEAAYGAYARQAIAFGAASARAIAQSGTVTFPKATSGSETITHYGIFDAVSAGNMLAYGTLSVSKQIVTNNTPSVAAGQVTITVNTGGASTYLANIWLDFVFRNTIFAQPAVYVGLATAVLADGTTGTTVTQPSGGAYARVLHAGWAIAAAGANSNSTAINFAAATAAWGTVTSGFTVDAASAGNILTYDNGVVDQAVASGDTVSFAVGAWTNTLD